MHLLTRPFPAVSGQSPQIPAWRKTLASWTLLMHTGNLRDHGVCLKAKIVALLVVVLRHSPHEGVPRSERAGTWAESHGSNAEGVISVDLWFRSLCTEFRDCPGCPQNRKLSFQVKYGTPTTKPTPMAGDHFLRGGLGFLHPGARTGQMHTPRLGATSSGHPGVPVFGVLFQGTLGPTTCFGRDPFPPPKKKRGKNRKKEQLTSRGCCEALGSFTKPSSIRARCVPASGRAAQEDGPRSLDRGGWGWGPLQK